MQKLAVQMLCYQLDTTWQFFTRTFKMQVQSYSTYICLTWKFPENFYFSTWQDHLYVQYVEVAVFQAEYQQLSGKIRENEAIIQSICEGGSDLGEVTGELDKLEDMMEVANG